MTLGALLAWGMPPSGLCLFSRDDVEEGLPWRHISVNTQRTNRRELAARAHELGADVWGFSGPESWSRANWRGALERVRATREELGAVGAIAEFEADWSDALEGEVEAFGLELRALALEMRVGVTFTGGQRWLDVLARACGLGVFAIVQMYGRTSTDGATMQRWLDRASSSGFGLRCCIAIAGWRSSERVDTAEEFREYLAALPRVGGAWVWPLADSTIPRFQREALEAYEPGGSWLGTAGQVALRALVRPAAALILGVLLVLVVLLVVAWRALRAQ